MHVIRLYLVHLIFLSKLAQRINSIGRKATGLNTTVGTWMQYAVCGQAEEGHPKKYLLPYQSDPLEGLKFASHSIT